MTNDTLIQPSTCADNLSKLAGQPADIAASAYQYRADRKPEENPPESWLALMRCAKLPLNHPLDRNAPALQQVLCALLWEEIRPIQKVELTWTGETQRRPTPEDLTIITLDHQGNASSWWNNLNAVPKSVPAVLSADGQTYVYELKTDTCGLVISVGDGKRAADHAVPTVRVLVGDVWKKMDLEIEWGFEDSTRARDYTGRVETYDGRAFGLAPLDGDTKTSVADPRSWHSTGRNASRRGVKLSLIYLGTSRWRKTQPYTGQPDDVARTIVTVWTQAGNFSFLAGDLEHGPILAPEYGFFVRRTSPLTTPLPRNEGPVKVTSAATSAQEFMAELRNRKLQTIRQATRARAEQSWQGAVTAMHFDLPPIPQPPAESEGPMQVEVPCARLTAQWKLGPWHLLRHCTKNPKTSRLWFDDYPYRILAAETYLILAALDVLGLHDAASAGYDQWLSLPLQPMMKPHELEHAAKRHGALADRPSGLFSDGLGSFTMAESSPDGATAMDGIHAYGPGCIGWAMAEHYRITGDKEWLKASISRMQANAEWMLRQRRFLASSIPGGERLWCKGLQPAHQATPDAGGLFLQWYWSEAFYCASVSGLATMLKAIDSPAAAKMEMEAAAYRQELLTAVERSIALSPVVQVRDGTYHSVIPFGCYMRGLGTGAWGWKRDGSTGHWGPLTFETDLSASPLMDLAGILPSDDVRIQGYLDVMEDRLLADNPRTSTVSWFLAGWQHQVGIQKTTEAHLACDDIPVFLRSFFNCSAIHLLPQDGYTFNEHVFQGPPDKIFEEAAFLYRFRNLLVMEEKEHLWLARATPRAWLEQSQKISVKNAPTQFGTVAYEITSDVDHGRISATIELPSRTPPKAVLLRLRHPKKESIQSVTVNGKTWKDFDAANELVRLTGCQGKASLKIQY